MLHNSGLDTVSRKETVRIYIVQHCGRLARAMHTIRRGHERHGGENTLAARVYHGDFEAAR